MPRLVFVLSVLGALLGALLSPALAGTAGAQTTFGDPDVLLTCELYQIVLSTGGETLTGAAEELRELGAPNPAGIEDAIDAVIAAEEAESADADTAEAFETLDQYYGGICQGIDQCPIVQGLVSVDRDTAAEAAAHLRDLNRPNPPGIAIALQGLIDPETDPDDYARFRVQAADWFAGACEDGADDAGADDAGAGDADEDSDDELAYGDDGRTEETEGDEPPADSYSDNYSAGNGANGAGNSDAGSTLPSTGFGTVGLFLAFAAFVAFTVGATLIVASDR